MNATTVTPKKHWHLTTDPDTRSDQGSPIWLRKDADRMARVLRKHSSKPIYSVACMAICRGCDPGNPGRAE